MTRSPMHDRTARLNELNAVGSQFEEVKQIRTENPKLFRLSIGNQRACALPFSLKF